LAFAIVASAAICTSLGVAIRIFGAVDGVNVEKCKFGRLRYVLDDGDAAFFVPLYSSNIQIINFAKISTNDAAYAVEFATVPEALRVVWITWKFKMGVLLDR
jgi:hypothetical protein